ncbi:MAG: regulator SirB [Rhodocyclaceae bacterium]|nr:MAG: regulator SirB [Rhodocyclaceae bacterium]
MQAWYPLLRHVHMTCAALSISGFLIRGILTFTGSSLPAKPLIRRLVDGNDSLLLLAAGGLVIVTGQYPGVSPWVTAKLVALLLYIGLGVAAFRLMPTLRYRVAAWLGALCVAAYIVSVALSKNPYGFFAAFLR